jgi:hypothetical protein
MTMGILSYLKIAGIVAVLAVVGYYAWSYQSLKATVVAQQAEIDNLKTAQEVMDKKQAAFDEFMKKKSVIRRRVVTDDKKTDEVVGSGDVRNVINLFRQLQQGGDKTHPPAPERKSRAKPAAG